VCNIKQYDHPQLFERVLVERIQLGELPLCIELRFEGES